jgi:choline dehydrogenase
VFDYDIVIVGAGSAGCAAAYRFSEDPEKSVLLLEAGGRGTSAVDVPAAWPTLLGTDMDWQYRTVAQPRTANRVHLWSQGKLLGGGSSINGMVFMRGAPWDYDEWAMRGNIGWDFASVLPAFRAMEHFPHGDPELRGVGGPVRISVVTDLNPITQAFLTACSERGFQPAPDFNGADAEGYAPHQLNAWDGIRQSARETLLDPASDRPNLTVTTGAMVTRLDLDSTGRVRAVEYVNGGRAGRAGVLGEVILAAGAIGSPKILMLSGVGPADEVSRHGIRVRIDLPGVGRNLHDHPAVPVTWESAKVAPEGRNQLIEAGLFCRSDSTLPRFDLQFACLHFPLVPEGFTGAPHGFSICGGVLNPLSRGRLTLRSADPAELPVVDPHYLEADADMRRLVRAVRIAREIAAERAFDSWRAREIAPGPDHTSDADLRDYVAATATTYYHPTGTCKMGYEPDAVVDARLLVHGTQNLRVADASIMPSIVSGNTNAAAMMIGWRVADLAGDEASPSDVRRFTAVS